MNILYTLPHDKASQEIKTYFNLRNIKYQEEDYNLIKNTDMRPSAPPVLIYEIHDMAAPGHLIRAVITDGEQIKRWADNQR